MAELSREEAVKFVNGIRLKYGGLDEKSRMTYPEEALESIYELRKLYADAVQQYFPAP